MIEIAERIQTHLQRFERDPKLNKRRGSQGLLSYWLPRASRRGRLVRVVYVAYQGGTALSKAEAEEYLDALDSGFVGTHWEAQRARKDRVAKGDDGKHYCPEHRSAHEEKQDDPE